MGLESARQAGASTIKNQQQIAAGVAVFDRVMTEHDYIDRAPNAEVVRAMIAEILTLATRRGN